MEGSQSTATCRSGIGICCRSFQQPSFSPVRMASPFRRSSIRAGERVFSRLAAWTGRLAAEPVQGIMAGAVVLCLALHAVTSVRVAPDYLAYFNTFAGGSDSAYQHLVDSSLDWGQDLPGLKHWL